MSKKKINICVLGANGQLGQEFKAISEFFPNFAFDFYSKDNLDISNVEQVKSVFNENTYNAVINCAAYTNVEGAESNTELANLINGTFVGDLASICSEKKMILVHFSTDYVFDGDSKTPYKESDKTNPINAYGASKLMGENKILEKSTEFLIFRTSWLFSSFGSNFVKTMLKLGLEKDEISVVSDQIGSPTYARDLAFDVLIGLEKILIENLKLNSGVYHYANDNTVSWEEFAKEIFKMKKMDCKVNPVLTKDYITKAKRPLWSVLSTNKINSEFEIFPSEWKDSLYDCLKLL